MDTKKSPLFREATEKVRFSPKMKILQKLIPKKELILADIVVGTMLIINGFTYESGRENFPNFQI